MSSVARPARHSPRAFVARAGSQPRHRAPLHVVPASAHVPTRASSGAFALFVAAVLAVGLLGLLVLNTLLAQGAFTTSDLTGRQSALETTAQALQQQVAVLESPQVLAVAAHQLGMVVTKNPVFLDPVTGRVWGVPLAGAYPSPVTPGPLGALGAPGARVGAGPATTRTPVVATTATPATPATRPATGTTRAPRPTTGTTKPSKPPKPTAPPKPGSH